MGGSDPPDAPLFLTEEAGEKVVLNMEIRKIAEEAKHWAEVREYAEKLFNEQFERAKAAGLETPDLVKVFAIASGLSVARVQRLCSPLAKELATEAFRTLIETLVANGCDVSGFPE